MPHFWKCNYCTARFRYGEDALHHERYFCEQSPLVDEHWNESPLNPNNKHCATCSHSASFLSEYGCYEVDAAGFDCPQRLISEDKRKFPCSAYVRCTHIPDVHYDTREFTIEARRYYRSFGLKEHRK